MLTLECNKTNEFNRIKYLTITENTKVINIITTTNSFQND